MTHVVPSLQTYPLTMTQPGETVRVVAIHGGYRLRKRLADLGLTVGLPVRVIQGSSSGPMLIAFKEDARLAVGHGVAHKIIVAPYDPDPGTN